jgi:hypothetical protein
VSGGIAPHIIGLCQLHSLFNLPRRKASWVHIGQPVNSKIDIYSGKKVKLSMLQAVETNRVVRRRGSHIL